MVHWSNGSLGFARAKVVKSETKTGEELRAVLFVTGDLHKTFHAEHCAPTWTIKSIPKEKNPMLEVSSYSLAFSEPASWGEWTPTSTLEGSDAGCPPAEARRAIHIEAPCYIGSGVGGIIPMGDNDISEWPGFQCKGKGSVLP